MTGLKVLALAPIFGAAAIATAGQSAQSPVVEYGALGLCGAVVMFLCNYLKGLTKQHREERAELVTSMQTKDKQLAELTKLNTAAYNRLADLLEDRPCLCKDQRIKPE